MDSIEDNVIKINSRSMSDPTLSDIDFKNITAWVRTTLTMKNVIVGWTYINVVSLQLSVPWELDQLALLTINQLIFLLCSLAHQIGVEWNQKSPSASYQSLILYYTELYNIIKYNTDWPLSNCNLRWLVAHSTFLYLPSYPFKLGPTRITGRTFGTTSYGVLAFSPFFNGFCVIDPLLWAPRTAWRTFV